MHTTTPTSETPPPASPLSGLLTLDEYQQQRDRLFNSLESLRWDIRKRRARLLEAGALLYIGGRYWINAPVYDETLLQDGRSAALRKGQEAA